MSKTGRSLHEHHQRVLTALQAPVGLTDGLLPARLGTLPRLGSQGSQQATWALRFSDHPDFFTMMLNRGSQAGV